MGYSDPIFNSCVSFANSANARIRSSSLLGGTSATEGRRRMPRTSSSMCCHSRPIFSLAGSAVIRGDVSYSHALLAALQQKTLRQSLPDHHQRDSQVLQNKSSRQRHQRPKAWCHKLHTACGISAQSHLDHLHRH